MVMACHLNLSSVIEAVFLCSISTFWILRNFFICNFVLEPPYKTYSRPDFIIVFSVGLLKLTPIKLISNTMYGECINSQVGCTCNSLMYYLAN